MITTKTCSTCEHFPNDHHCVGCVWDEDKGENTKWELKKNPIVIERAVLDKIRAEIDDLDRHFDNDCFSGNKDSMFKCNEVLQIIDRYRKGEDGTVMVYEGGD